MKTLQKFAAAHAPIHNHFNVERHLNGHEVFNISETKIEPSYDVNEQEDKLAAS